MRKTLPKKYFWHYFKNVTHTESGLMTIPETEEVQSTFKETNETTFEDTTPIRIQLENNDELTLVEEEEAVIARNLLGTFAYKEGKMNVDLSQSDEGYETGVVVITSLEEVVNQREYVAKSGVTYQLSDTTKDGVTRTTTLLSSNNYTLIIEFENLTEESIYELLDNLDVGTI